MARRIPSALAFFATVLILSAATALLIGTPSTSSFGPATAMTVLA